VSNSPLEVVPIGVARTPFREKVAAPRQATVARGVKGEIEIFPAYEHALADLADVERIWVLFWFHLAKGWRPKVLPPRSARRRGVLSTRSPHRPNPIGLSCVRLVRVNGLVLDVEDVDLVDGSPILDVKPYLPYADAFPEARAGWLEAPDPLPGYDVRWTDAAREQIAWLEGHGVDLGAPVERILSLGPQPHAYRRIKKDGSGLLLAYKEWRLRFRVDGERVIEVLRVHSGFRASQLYAPAAPPALDVHRAFVERFPV
jgi:tRNA (adenine37-N6)-methyltransferase